MCHWFNKGPAKAGRAWMFGVLLTTVVSPAWADLAAPTTTLVTEGATLDPSDIPGGGLEVTTMTGGPAYNQQSLAVRLLVNGQVIEGPRTVVGLSTRPIRLLLAKALFEPHAGADVQISYCVGVGDPALPLQRLCEQAASPPLSFKLAQGFSGSYIHDLSSKLLVAVYRNGEMLLPKPGVDREVFSFVRQAPGATGYASSDTSVATVDSQGRVTALRDGNATITAQLPGQPQAYQLTVRGIHQFEVVSSTGATWDRANQQCVGLGGRLPEALDFNDLKGRFALKMRELGLPDYPIWGGKAGLGSGTATTFDPRSDTVTSETTDANTLRQVLCFRS
jgi:hypothetical protein